MTDSVVIIIMIISFHRPPINQSNFPHTAWKIICTRCATWGFLLRSFSFALWITTFFLFFPFSACRVCKDRNLTERCAYGTYIDYLVIICTTLFPTRDRQTTRRRRRGFKRLHDVDGFSVNRYYIVIRYSTLVFHSSKVGMK